MDRLDERQQQLAEEAHSRARDIAKRYARLYPQLADDLDSAAHYGAVRAASTYKPELKGVWLRWSGLCIHGSILQCFRDAKLGRRAFDEDDMEWIHDQKPDAEIERVDARLGHDKLLAMLPEKHRRICALMYGDEGLTAGQAATQLGYTPNHGDKIHREAIDILRKHLAA